MKRVSFRALAAAGVLTVFAGLASAGSDTEQFKVRMKINANCTIGTIAPMAFADQTFLTNPVDAQTTLTVNCTKGTSATVDLGSVRAMKRVTAVDGSGNPTAFGSETINFELYTDDARTTPWTTVNVTGQGVDSSGTSLETGTDGTNPNSTSRIVYGQVPAQSTTNAGDYEATVTATVTY